MKDSWYSILAIETNYSKSRMFVFSKKSLSLSFRLSDKNIDKTRYRCNHLSQWCPICPPEGLEPCHFNGTLFHITDIKTRFKRSLKEDKNYTISIEIKNKRTNETVVSFALNTYCRRTIIVELIEHQSIIYLS